jgi:hypothetical protein
MEPRPPSAVSHASPGRRDLIPLALGSWRWERGAGKMYIKLHGKASGLWDFTCCIRMHSDICVHVLMKERREEERRLIENQH